MAWIGAAISAAAGYMASKDSKKQAQSASNTPSVQTNEPWYKAQPFLNQGFESAVGILTQGYPEQTMGALRARGMQGSTASNEANNLATSTMRGDYLNSNPFLDGTVKDAMGMAGSKINSQFAGNNYGSSAHQEWLGKGLMNAALPYMSQNYENERGRQYAAMAQAPALQSMDYQNIAAQQQADFMPWDFLGRYQGIVSGMNTGGGTTTTQTPYFSNSANSFMGGALLANNLYNQYQQPSNVTFGGSDPYAGGFGSGGYY